MTGGATEGTDEAPAAGVATAGGRPAPQPHILDPDAFTAALAAPAAPPDESWRPVVVRPVTAHAMAPQDTVRFAALCRAHRLRVCDALDRPLAAARRTTSTPDGVCALSGR